MEWLEGLNKSVDYIEEHLEDTVEVESAARIACCSIFHFQRMFSYIAGVPLAEYVRRRRMTEAAFELSKGKKVADVALRYGYESPTSFNRAFQRVHGITPSAAQKEGATLKAFPRISFHIVIKGDVEMEYRIVKKEAFRIVGVKEPLEKEIEKNFQIVPLMWQKAGENGTLGKLVPMMDSEPMGVLGVSACQNEDWEYYIAVASSQACPEGMDEYEVPAITWAVFSGSGKMPEAIQEMEKRVVTEWLPTSGFEYGNAPDMEVYLDANPENSKFEIWMPVVKK